MASGHCVLQERHQFPMLPHQPQASLSGVVYTRGHLRATVKRVCLQYKVLSGGNLLFTISGVLKKHPRYLNVSGVGVKQGVATRKRKTAAAYRKQ